MANQITAASYPNRADWIAHARVTRITIRLVKWRCPDCDTQNVTKLFPERRRRAYDKIEARCGKCHGTSRTLLTKNDYTIDP